MAKEKAKNFTDLIVWQKAHQFVLDVYRFTAKFPETETYGLTSQLRRAAISVPANIAEGFTKATRPEKARFLNIAQGSLAECRYYLILSNDLSYGYADKLLQELEVVSKLLTAYARAIRSAGHDKK